MLVVFVVVVVVVDVPIVRLELGSKLKLEAIKEGDDVYMECSIRANPWVTKVTWKHNVIIIIITIITTTPFL